MFGIIPAWFAQEDVVWRKKPAYIAFPEGGHAQVPS